MFSDLELLEVTKHPDFWPFDVYTASHYVKHKNKPKWNRKYKIVPYCAKEFNEIYGTKFSQKDLKRLEDLMEENDMPTDELKRLKNGRWYR